MKRCCDVPYCNNVQEPPLSFDNTNGVICWTCKKMACKECTDRIWSGEWNGKIFYKPKLIIKGLIHQVWKCPHCRASFDRFIPSHKH